MNCFPLYYLLLALIHLLIVSPIVHVDPSGFETFTALWYTMQPRRSKPRSLRPTHEHFPAPPSCLPEQQTISSKQFTITNTSTSQVDNLIISHHNNAGIDNAKFPYRSYSFSFVPYLWAAQMMTFTTLRTIRGHAAVSSVHSHAEMSSCASTSLDWPKTSHLSHNLRLFCLHQLVYLCPCAQALVHG